MIKKTITYTDYNGLERTEDFYFNLSKAEAAEMMMSTSEGLENTISRIVKEQDAPAMVKMFKDVILRSYGEKSSDGKRFIKSKELSESFSQTEAYSQLFMELVSDTSAVEAFIDGVLPIDKTAVKPTLVESKSDA